MPRPRILVTRRWPEAVERRLCALFDTTLNPDDHRLSADELRAALRDFDAVLPTVSDRLDASVLDASLFKTGAPRARILANYGVGYSHIDIDAARGLGLVVTNTPTTVTTNITHNASSTDPTYHNSSVPVLTVTMQDNESVLNVTQTNIYTTV